MGLGRVLHAEGSCMFTSRVAGGGGGGRGREGWVEMLTSPRLA